MKMNAYRVGNKGGCTPLRLFDVGGVRHWKGVRQWG